MRRRTSSGDAPGFGIDAKHVHVVLKAADIDAAVQEDGALLVGESRMMPTTGRRSSSVGAGNLERCRRASDLDQRGQVLGDDQPLSCAGEPVHVGGVARDDVACTRPRNA